MRRAMLAVLAVGALLALGACGGTPETTAVPGSSAVPSTVSSAEASTTAETTPVVKKSRVTETRRIPYGTKRVSDSGLAEGTTKVRTRGRTGVKTLTYEVTLTDGVETSKRLLRSVVTRRPVTRVVAVGTRQTRQCDENYSGACVPVASDVDCEGNNGNGPAYVSGPVRVIGDDIYDLDRDGDNIACD